jgi:Tol biopolymer transport system component
VTVQLPDVVELSRTAPPPAQTPDAHAGGAWWTYAGCDGGACNLQVRSEGTTHIDLNIESITGEWSPARLSFAAAVRTFDGHNQVLLIEGDTTPSMRIIADTPDRQVTTFAWLDESRLLLSTLDDGAPSLRVLDTSGAVAPVADLASVAIYFYPSPDRSRVLFTQSASDGWQLWMLDVASGAVTNLGNMGSDPANVATPAETSPEATGKGGPLYISWSPDGTQVAFGGGFEPPYIMTIVQLDVRTPVVTQFPSGYPGEIRWSADSTKIAVSTYDIERTHHETWVVDPTTGEGRHLMDGCVIVWSPDGRFLAVHGEDVKGITIINVETADRAQLTHNADDAPIEWLP